MSYQPTSLYSEIAPNLFMGGTADEDVIHHAVAYTWLQPPNSSFLALRFRSIVA